MHQIAYSRLRFLVASGDVVTRDTLRVILEAFGGGTIYQARDGFEALDMLSTLEPDIVLAERDMPLVNGLEMTRLIRLTEFTGGPTGNPYAPVILITKDLRKEDIRDATDAGATEYMVKPLDCEALYSLVEGVVMDPRPFIQLANYFGPDRRRAPQSVNGDRRKARSESGTEVRTTVSRKGAAVEEVHGDHIVMRPPNSLSLKAALPANQERESRGTMLARATAAVDALQSGYRKSINDDLMALEDACEALIARPSLVSAKTLLTEAAEKARQRADRFGFVMASRIATGLGTLLKGPALDHGSLNAIQGHIDALDAVIRSVGAPEDDALIDTMVQHLTTLTEQMRGDLSETRRISVSFEGRLRHFIRQGAGGNFIGVPDATVRGRA